MLTRPLVLAAQTAEPLRLFRSRRRCPDARVPAPVPVCETRWRTRKSLGRAPRGVLWAVRGDVRLKVRDTMAVGAHFLAFDLGAESGRAMLGRLRAGVLDISEIHRFVNEPVRQNGSLHWDVLRIWLELKQGMERAAGTYRERRRRHLGLRLRARRRAGRAARTPITIATGGPTASWKPCSNAYRPTKSTRSRGSSSCRSTRSISSTRHASDAAAARCGDAFRHDTRDLINYWLTGDMTAEFTNATTTQFIDARTRSWATDLLQALERADAFCRRSSSRDDRRPRWCRCASSLQGTRVVAPACHDTGSAVAAVRADGHRAFLSSGTWSLLGTG